MWKDKVVLVTGGGTGIGLATAVEFARQGAMVVIAGRRVDRLQTALGQLQAVGRGDTLAMDVTDEAGVAAGIAEIVQRHGRLDVVVANAGFSVGGKVAELTDAEWRRQFDTNVFGLLNTVRHAMPELRKSEGRIALIGSVAAFLPSPKFGAYGASKATVRSIGETLTSELQGSPVSCTTIHPGFVESEIAFVDNEGVFQADRKDKRPAQLMWKADDAARVMVKAIAQRKGEFVFTGHGKLAVLLSRVAPWLVRRFAR